MDLETKIMRVLSEHQLSPPNGGTASVSWCTCACGEQNRAPGNTRGYAQILGFQHVAKEIARVVRVDL